MTHEVILLTDRGNFLYTAGDEHRCKQAADALEKFITDMGPEGVLDGEVRVNIPAACVQEIIVRQFPPTGDPNERSSTSPRLAQGPV